MEEVSAALDDTDEGDDEERHDLHHLIIITLVNAETRADLHHAADLPHPGGQVDIALSQRPVEHLRHHPSLEGDHSHDEKTYREHHVPSEGKEGTEPSGAADLKKQIIMMVSAITRL